MTTRTLSQQEMYLIDQHARSRVAEVEKIHLAKMADIKADLRDQVKPVVKREYMGELNLKLHNETIPQLELIYEERLGPLSREEYRRLSSETVIRVRNAVENDFDTRMWPAMELEIMAHHHARMAANLQSWLKVFTRQFSNDYLEARAALEKEAALKKAELESVALKEAERNRAEAESALVAMRETRTRRQAQGLF